MASVANRRWRITSSADVVGQSGRLAGGSTGGVAAISSEQRRAAARAASISLVEGMPTRHRSRIPHMAHFQSIWMRTAKYLSIAIAIMLAGWGIYQRIGGPSKLHENAGRVPVATANVFVCDAESKRILKSSLRPFPLSSEEDKVFQSIAEMPLEPKRVGMTWPPFFILKTGKANEPIRAYKVRQVWGGFGFQSVKMIDEGQHIRVAHLEAEYSMPMLLRVPHETTMEVQTLNEKLRAFLIKNAGVSPLDE